MKLESFENLYFVISVFVPGFIYSGILSAFVPHREYRETEALLLRYLVGTAVNYAVLSPLIYLLAVKHFWAATPVGQGLVWFGILFIAPIVLAMIRAKIIQNDGFSWFYRWLGLRAISLLIATEN
jgi:hypothetical protein